MLYENSNSDITIGKEARGDDTFIYDAKRLIGKKFSDEDVQGLIPTLGFNVSEGSDGKCMIDVPNIGLYSPEQIIADILESMRLIVEMHFDRQFSKLKAFITIPGDFDDDQKEAVERAAKMAGL